MFWRVAPQSPDDGPRDAFIEHCALDDGAIFMDTITELVALDVMEAVEDEEPLDGYFPDELSGASDASQPAPAPALLSRTAPPPPAVLPTPDGAQLVSFEAPFEPEPLFIERHRPAP